ncbi:Gti1/Pac2 family-domain-containing protein [Epithele typhae]|uniref:Gti1/Pac2 family-domain-containing protein n=1 Tax=Epithele typhae TaxID=378194 RepID=UPI0020084560|nr:Gti1/Pac2 family-domain-containing protein [Epithele typhae]KAH9926662.1 Gti1/Pac2 family-domain-containing protein [Epithele typhae]
MTSHHAAHPSDNPGHATHPALHLRDARDAHVVFEAVRLGILPLITRRLTATEREQLASGNVYVWEEAEHKQVGGLERWTDGRRWSQSRMRGDYLFYEEKIETTPEEKEAKAARRARRTLDPFAAPPAPIRRQDRPSKPDGLTKQTYSTHVHTHPGELPRKWHIVAYFSGDDYTRLPVVENYEYLRNIRAPEGIFTSAKGNIARFGRVLEDSDGLETPTAAGGEYPDWAPAPWALSSSSLARGHPTERPMSSSSSSSSSATAIRHSYQYPVPSSHHRAQSPSLNTLPRLSTVVPVGPLTPPASPMYPTSPGGVPGNYKPRTGEDRRAIGSFRLAL